MSRSPPRGLACTPSPSPAGPRPSRSGRYRSQGSTEHTVYAFIEELPNIKIHYFKRVVFNLLFKNKIILNLINL